MLLLLFLALPAHAKRIGPAEVAPLTWKGLRYEAVHFKEGTMKHNGGYVRVSDEKSGAAVCLREVYEVKYLPQLETDVQDNFITKLQVRGSSLVVNDEKGVKHHKPLKGFCR